MAVDVAGVFDVEQRVVRFPARQRSVAEHLVESGEGRHWRGRLPSFLVYDKELVRSLVFVRVTDV